MGELSGSGLAVIFVKCAISDIVLTVSTLQGGRLRREHQVGHAERVLEITVEEALEAAKASKNTTVRKLITDNRFKKKDEVCMDGSTAEERFRTDSRHLAEIGRRLSEQLQPVTVRLPAELIGRARAAWLRDEVEELQAEDFEKWLMRSLAGEFALIGLAAAELAESEGGEVVVRLDPRRIAHALFAADLWEDRPWGVGA
ncbi:hypothetical protein OHA25_55555 [Nonomuraea sp. NBC_00507]|uniref:hypothetical protein n=1 Tax=Nonomuraea sp. NBC_00507 TaxID=2976002 RepID=UPI002E16BC9B